MKALWCPVLLCLSAAAAAQGSPERGMKLYQDKWCHSCHGTAGQAVEGSKVPALAGMPRDNFIAQMKDFRGENARKATVMHQIAKGFNEAQIEQLAAYFAAQKR